MEKVLLVKVDYNLWLALPVEALAHVARAFVVKEEVNYSGPNEMREVPLDEDGLQMAVVQRSRIVVPVPTDDAVLDVVQPPAPSSPTPAADDVPF